MQSANTISGFYYQSNQIISVRFQSIVKPRRMLRCIGSGRVLSKFMRSYHNDGKIPELTKNRYPVKRLDFATLNDKDVTFFENMLSSSRVLSAQSDVQSFNIDFLRTCRGDSQIVLKPKTTAEVAEIVKYCNQRRLAVVPQGGNTGLVGGSVPVFDEIIISTTLMDRIESIDAFSGIMTCQSGAILEKLEDAVREQGLCMPLDLGAKGSCNIGGNISTNAGGLRLLRYGNLHGSVLDLEVVKADGTVLDLMSNFKKDNTGYHLKHLFIGSEGTLGLVTKVAILCPTASKSINIAFLGLDSYENVRKTFLSAKQELGEILSSCEMIDRASLGCSARYLKQEPPIGDYPFYMLIETSGSKAEHDEEKLMGFLNRAMEKNLVLDGTTTNDITKMKQIWLFRETIAVGILADGYCFKYDISLPLDKFYDIVPAMEERLGSLATRVTGYGHIGDSNLHLNISCPEFSQEIYSLVEPYVYEYTSNLKGSVSAEHGIGFLKKKYTKFSKSAEALALMKEMKMVLDPNGILNPYKVIM